MNRNRLLLTLSAAAAAGAVYALYLRPRHLRWGATDEEAAMALPGDDFVPDVSGQATHAITINTPASMVWPWLAQVGQDRAGFYSYSWLEDLVGCHMPNVDRLVPELQDLKVGDELWLHPKAPPLPVLIVEPHHAIVFGSNTGEPGTWGFYLIPNGEYSTRLIVRGRGEWNPTLFRQMFNFAVFEPAHFIMERKMLLTINHLAESHSRRSQDCVEVH